MNLLLISLAPVFIIAFYVYFRDKYEKEPVKMLLKALMAGCIITIPVILIEQALNAFMPQYSQGGKAFYQAFVVASLCEEGFKYLAFVLLIWSNRNFNEKFDGIVYAVFISLGFAAIENVMYVFHYGLEVGYMRALASVPGHALFGVAMGYYFSLAKFYPWLRIPNLIRSLLYPVLLHGLFDFILMYKNKWLLLAFIPYVLFLYIDGFKRMKILSIPQE